VITFAVDPAKVVDGTTVTVRWEVDAEIVTLERLNAAGVSGGLIPIPNNGQQNFVISSKDGRVTTFRLTARRGGRSVTRAVNVEVGCAIDWFFTPTLGDTCPTQAATTLVVASYTFDRGLAFYVPTTNLVYMLSNDGRAAAYQNTWIEGIVIPGVGVPFPPGRVAPVGQIGFVWATQRWIDGQTFPNAFGFVSGPPQGYVASLQFGPDGSTLYISGPNLTAYEIVLRGGTWRPVGRVR
jgi:hypothetical protein